MNYLKKGTVNNRKIVETFFYWIAVNIEYDRELMLKQDKTSQDIPTDIILLRKKTICAGYSNLLNEMCHFVGIESVVVEGFAQTMIDEDTGVPHAWNAVKLGSKWYLIDST